MVEEAGLETDGMAETTSQLQAKLKALTDGKVDIMVDANNFKNTTQILREMSAEWEHMTDVEQAAALELLGGKRQANTLSAIISNFDIVEDAIEASENSAGSAMEENAKVLDSIQGRINLFNNAVEVMWSNLLDDEWIKRLVDGGTALVKFIDKLGSLRTVLFGILTYYSVFKKDKIDFAEMFGFQTGKDGGYKSLMGQQGLTGWVSKGAQWVKNLKGNKKGKTPASDILGDPTVEVQDFAAAIQDNIDNYVHIDTSNIDGEIGDIQNRLMIARKELTDAKKADWNYYKSLGSKAPAQDRDNRIADKQRDVAELEKQLSSLEARRDSIVASAANVVATDVDNVKPQIQSYQSFLGILSDVKNKILEMPDEASAATILDGFNNAAKAGQQPLLDYVSTLNDAPEAIQAYLASLNGEEATLPGLIDYIKQHNDGIKKSGFAAKAAAVGHAALNAAISMGISFLISGAISIITNLINRHKKLAESVKETMTEYKNATKTLKDHYDTIEDIKDDYAELADGVDNLGRNVSLSTDEYKRYNEITNKIAEMFPNMVTGYTEEGNAIIALKGNVEALTEAYEAEAKAARDAIIVQSHNIWKDFKNKTTKDGAGSGRSQMEKLEFFEQIIKTGVVPETTDKITLDNWFEDAGIYDTNWFSSYKTYNKIVPEHIQQIKAYTDMLKSQLEANVLPVQSMIDAYLGNSESYKKLSDEGKNLAQSIISGFNLEFYTSDDIKDLSDAELISWIDTNVIQKLQNTDNMAEFTAAFNLQTQFNDGKIPVDEYIDKVNEFVELLEQLGFDNQIITTIKGIFEIEDYEVKQNSAKEILSPVADSLIGTLTKEDLDVIDQNKTKWKEELEVDGKTTMTWGELTKKIAEAKEMAWSASTSFEKLSEKIDGIQSAYSTLSDAATQYNNDGYLTLDNLQALLSLEPEYLAALQMENGQLSINQSVLQTMIQTKLDEAKATAVQTAITQLNALAARTEADAIANSANATNNAITPLGAYASNLGIVAQNAIGAAGAVAAFNAAVAGAQSNVFVSQAEIDQVLSTFNTSMELIDSVGANLSSNFNNVVNPGSGSGSSSEDDKFQKEMEYWERRIGAEQSRFEQVQNEIDLLEKQGKMAGKDYYEEQIESEKRRLDLLVQQKEEAKKYLNQFGEGSDEWWEVANTLNDLESEIDNVTSSLLDLRDAQAEVDWYIFDQSHERFSNLHDELSTIRDLIAPNGEEDWFDDEGMWTDKGTAYLAAYITDLKYYEGELESVNEELAKYSKPYAGNEAHYKDLGIDSEQKLYDTIEKLKDQQYGYAKSISDTQQSVADMYESQIDAVEEWSNKAIESYNDYIDVVKEALDAERDLYDFKKNIQKQTKDIAALERRIASLSGSDNASDIAERRKLEAELAEAREGLNDSYYDHAKDAQEQALSEEAEAYEKTMNKFIENLRTGLDTALLDMEGFIGNVAKAVTNNAPAILEQYESLGIALDDSIIKPWSAASEAVKNYAEDGEGGLAAMNAWISEGGVFPTFKDGATDALKSPWLEGSKALDEFQKSVVNSMRSVMDSVSTNVSGSVAELKNLQAEINKINDTSIKPGGGNGGGIVPQNYTGGDGGVSGAIRELQIILNNVFGSKLNADGIWGPATEKALRAAQETMKATLGGYLVKVNGRYTEDTRKNMDAYLYYRIYKMKQESGSSSAVGQGIRYLTQYKEMLPAAFHAKGTLGTKRDELAITDESWIGEEITLAAGKNGQLQYLKKGSAVMPADISANLVEWGKLNPDMMKVGGAPNLNMISNAINKPEFNLSFDALVKADRIDEGTLPEIKKYVTQEINSLVKQMNYAIKGYKR